MTENSASEDAREEIITRNGWALAFVATTLGLQFIVAHIESGTRRFLNAVWHSPMLVWGSPASWGVVILTAGVLMILGRVLQRRRLIHYGCLIALVWCCAIDGAQVLSFFHDTEGQANAVGIVLWTYLAYIYGERLRLSSGRFYA